MISFKPGGIAANVYNSVPESVIPPAIVIVPDSPYIEFAKKLNNATLVNLLPVEHESRKLPGTGLYLKQPYFGTRQERADLRDTANRIMNNSGLKTLQWPDEWIDEDGMKMFE